MKKLHMHVPRAGIDFPHVALFMFRQIPAALLALSTSSQRNQFAPGTQAHGVGVAGGQGQLAGGIEVAPHLLGSVGVGAEGELHAGLPARSQDVLAGVELPHRLVLACRVDQL